jgi:hypothetical protein
MLAQLTRTAVYGPVRTVVWQGSVGDRGPYADQIGLTLEVPAPQRANVAGSQHVFATRLS